MPFDQEKKKRRKRRKAKRGYRRGRRRQNGRSKWRTTHKPKVKTSPRKRPFAAASTSAQGTGPAAKQSDGYYFPTAYYCAPYPAGSYGINGNQGSSSVHKNEESIRKEMTYLMEHAQTPEEKEFWRQALAELGSVERNGSSDIGHVPEPLLGGTPKEKRVIVAEIVGHASYKAASQSLHESFYVTQHHDNSATSRRVTHIPPPTTRLFSRSLLTAAACFLGLLLFAFLPSLQHHCLDPTVAPNNQDFWPLQYDSAAHNTSTEFFSTQPTTSWRQQDGANKTVIDNEVFTSVDVCESWSNHSSASLLGLDTLPLSAEPPAAAKYAAALSEFEGPSTIVLPAFFHVRLG